MIGIWIMAAIGFVFAVATGVAIAEDMAGAAVVLALGAVAGSGIALAMACTL